MRSQRTKKPLTSEQYRIVTIVVGVVAKYFSIKPKDILSDSQEILHTWPRQVAQTICRRHFIKIGDAVPLATLGSATGGRDHATVLWSIKVVDGQTQYNNQRRLEVQKVERLVYKVIGTDEEKKINTILDLKELLANMPKSTIYWEQFHNVSEALKESIAILEGDLIPEMA